MFRNTSLAERRNPALFPKRPSSIFIRRVSKPVADLWGVPYTAVLTRAWVSIRNGRVPSIMAATAMPLRFSSCMGMKHFGWIVHCLSPFCVISNRASSAVDPNLFFILRSMRYARGIRLRTAAQHPLCVPAPCRPCYAAFFCNMPDQDYRNVGLSLAYLNNRAAHSLHLGNAPGEDPGVANKRSVWNLLSREGLYFTLACSRMFSSMVSHNTRQLSGIFFQPLPERTPLGAHLIWRADSSPETYKVFKCGAQSGICRLSVDFRCPVRPSKTTEPGQDPAQNPFQFSRLLRDIRSCCVVGNSLWDTARRCDGLPSVRCTNDYLFCKVFHSPQEGQRPSHLADSAPQFWQNHAFFILLIIQR